MCETNTVRNSYKTKALRLLAEGFKKEFIDAVYEDPRFTECIHEIGQDFIDSHIPIMEEDSKFDLLTLLADKVSITTHLNGY